MRILIVSQYFWPENFIINDLALKLSEIGHMVTVATGKPNYPGGTIFPGYRRAGIQEETYQGSIRIVRVPLHPRKQGGSVNLIRNYLSFVYQASVHLPIRLRAEPFDAILVFAVSPITAAIPAVVLKRHKKAHLAIWVQDLWPESLEATGYVRNPYLLRLVKSMVRWIYRAADTLLVQSEAFVEVVAACSTREKTIVLQNCAPAHIGTAPSLALVDSTLFTGDFNIVFAGNLGRAQNLDTVLRAAEMLAKNSLTIRFIIAGDGSETDWLKREIKDRRIPNIVLTGLLDRVTVSALFRRADALLVTLGSDAALNRTIPSKIQAYLQAAKPILGALNGEGARVLCEAGAGFTVASGDAEGLARAILNMAKLPASSRAAFGHRAHAYFLMHYEPEQVARKLVNILSSRMHRGTDREKIQGTRDRR